MALIGHLERTRAPTDRPVERLDVRELPPPEPLRKTLELLSDLDQDVVLLQVNDRAPQHLYQTLEEQGYRHDTVEADDSVLTAVWRD